MYLLYIRYCRLAWNYPQVRPVPDEDVEATVETALRMFSEQCKVLYSQLTPRDEAIQLVQHAGGADNAYVISGGGR